MSVFHSRLFIHSRLKVTYSIKAKQAACQNMILAGDRISRILLMTPFTIFANPLLGLEQKNHLQFSRGISLLHYPTLFEIPKKTLNWCRIITVRATEYDWHAQAFDLVHSLVCSIITGVVHQNPSICSPVWPFWVQDSSQLSQKQPFHESIRIYLSEGEVDVTFCADGRDEGDVGWDHLGVARINDPTFSPAPSFVVFEIYPSLVYIDDYFSLLQFLK